MEPDLTPEEIRRAQFRTVLRGYEADEVTTFLDRVAAEIEDLLEDRARLSTRLGEFADRDLKTEFDDVGREVTSVLQAAREAAESMRERAGADAARWRGEATAEAEALLRDARSDAEALRGDAWAAGTEMLNQVVAEIRKMRQDAERETLTITGEAEREAHRMVSASRREAEDLVRASTMEAERIATQAKKAHDETIDQALRAAETAQERTRALEERREELLVELEHARATLTRLEEALEERRDDLRTATEVSSSVKVVTPGRYGEVEEVVGTWEPGETVRVVRSGRSVDDPEPLADEVVEDLARIKRPVASEAHVDERVDVEEPVEEPAAEEQPVEEAPTPPQPEPVPEIVPDVEVAVAPTPPPDAVGALFASLRGGPEPVAGEPPAGETVTTAPPEPAVTDLAPSLSTSGEWIDEREARLLPISNRALRGVKRAVTEAQNVALDSLRTDGSWEPDRSELAEVMRADLIGLWAESYSAGHGAAQEMTGERLRRPETPSSNAADTFGTALAMSLSSALDEAGSEPRERQAAASRVFRGWRNDEAERRIRELALAGYHRGLVDSVGEVELQWVAGGVPCSACLEASADPGANLPPVHSGCGCTITIRNP